MPKYPGSLVLLVGGYRLPLKELPTEDFEDRQNWVEESLNALFSALNPTYKYEISVSLLEAEEELEGDATVTVQNEETGEDLFSFNLMSSKNHTEINQLKILNQVEGADYISLLKNKSNTLHEETAEDSLWLLGNTELQNKIQHPFYKLFSQPLVNNDAKINFLKTLNNDTFRQSEFFKDKLSSVQLMIKNVLSSLSWEDEEIVKRVFPVLLSLMEVKEFQGSFKEPLKKLRELDLSDTENFSQISLNMPLEKLETIRLDRLGISKLDGLENVPNLKVLSLNNTSELTKLSFLQPLEKLETINLDSSGISKLDGLENVPNLKALSLSNTSELTQLSFPQPLKKLEILKLDGSGISKLDGLENLPNLKLADFCETKNLTRILFIQPLTELSTIGLNGSGISELDGLENLLNLKTLELDNTKNLTTLSFKKTNETVEELKIENSNISRINGLGFLENLKTLNLEGSSNIKSLKFEKRNKDLVLRLKGSGIKREDIEGIEYLNERKIFGLN